MTYRRWLPITIVCLLVTQSIAFAQTYEFEGAQTPQEAAQAYLEAFADNDIQRMASVFAIESLVEHYQFDKQLGRMGAYFPTAELQFPNANPLYVSANIESRRAAIVQRICWQMIAYSSPATEFAVPTIFSADDRDAQIADFVAQYEKNGDAFAEKVIEITGFVDPSDVSEKYISELSQKNIAGQLAVSGGEALQNVVVRLNVNHEPYLFCCDAVRYGQKWYIYNLGGFIGSLLDIGSAQGGLTPWA